MNFIVKKIKIALLKRQTVELYGKVKRYSKQIRNWENRMTAYSISAKVQMSKREFNEITGSIPYYSKLIENWKIAFESKKVELQSLGVKVDLVL